MKPKYFIKIILIVGFFAGVISAGSFFISSSKPKKTTVAIQPDNLFGWKYPVAKFPPTGITSTSLAYSDIRDPGGISKGLPVRLKIPVIGVDSAIEDAYITADGRMDVPEGSINVAWFALGPHPGQKGSAVIGGHFGIDNGIPKVFYDLNKLQRGDKVYVVDDNDDTLAFAVSSTHSYNRDADSTPVFTSTDNKAHLNLITCEGVWNQVDDSYPDRLVIFTDAIPSEGAVAVKPKLPATAVSTPEPTPTTIPVLSPKNTTPTDVLVTSLLLISITFFLIKIF